MNEEITLTTQRNLIANLNKKIHEAVEEKWAKDHYGDISEDWRQQEERRVINKIVDHLINIGIN